MSQLELFLRLSIIRKQLLDLRDVLDEHDRRVLHHAASVLALVDGRQVAAESADVGDVVARTP